MLLDSPCPSLPIGEQADYLAKIVKKEREYGSHFPVACDQIDIQYWQEKAKHYTDQTNGIDIVARPTDHPDQLTLCDEIVGKFNPQQLVDAAIAVGGNPFCFLGFGPLNSHFPSLLMFHPEWTERNCSEPIALVTPLRV